MSIANLRLVPDPQIVALHKHPDAVEGFIFGSDDDETVTHVSAHELDLGEGWAALDLLLADVAFIGAGGRTLAEVGKGPARSFTSAEVAELAQKLSALSGRALKKRAKQAAPGTLEAFEQLKAFVATGAAKKLGMVAYLS